MDFVKCDDIAREYPHCQREIELISDACRACGRDMVLSLSPGPAPLEQAEHLKRYANMWRITDDFWDDWRLLRGMFERAEKWCIHAAPGHWPDADMLPIAAVRQCDNPPGWTRFTRAEQRTMTSLWAMMRSPMMIGSELTAMDDFTLSLLTNADVLAILRESWCAHPLFTRQDAAAWIAPRRDGTGVYAALFNLSDEDRLLTLPLSALGLTARPARELWSDEVTCGDALTAALAPHDAALWLITEADPC